MYIILSVISIKGHPPFSSMSYTFDQEGGTVGRDHKADWVLLDENKYLSGIHFKIHCDGKSFSVMDLSTNGTHINDSILPLGIDNSHILKVGDQITIGEYIIMSSSAEAFKSPETKVDDYDFISSSTNEPTSREDPFFSSQGYFSDSGVSKAQKKKTNLGQKSSFVDSDEIDSPDNTLKDPFFSTGDESFNPDKETYSPELDDEPVARGSFSVDMNTPLRTNSMNATPLQDFEKEQYASIRKAGNNAIEETDVFDFLDDSDTNTNQVKNAINIETESISTLKNKNVPIKVSTKTKKVMSITDKNAIESFLKGAGINQDSLASDVPVELFETIGETLSAVLQGTIDLLRSRSEIKNHLHLDRTIINSVENNPLKFMPNAQQVILHLLTKEANDNSYLSLTLALEEAFDDIKAHQMAMTAATEKALKSVIKEHFSPKSLADSISKTNPISAVIPIQRQAKLWNMFETLYENIEERATESFQRLLDHEISNAYEEQLLEIKSLRQKENEFSK